jgi:hypothetical protein
MATNSFSGLTTDQEHFATIHAPDLGDQTGCTIRYSPQDGISTHIIFNSVDPQQPINNQSSSAIYPTLLGQLHSGPPVTLLNTYISTYSGGATHAASVILKSGAMLVGKHIVNIDTDQFESGSNYLSYFPSWYRKIRYKWKANYPATIPVKLI